MNINFRTEVIPDKSDKSFTYRSSALFLGSCFTENIGNRLKKLRFNIDINPFGIVYNPVSVANVLNFLVEKRIFTDKDINFRNGLWFSFYHHGSFSNPDKNKCLELINDSIDKGHAFLKSADFVFITFGTAWVYKHKQQNFIVSNNHKLPAEDFDRFILSVDEIVELYEKVIENVRNFNREVNIVFTVSPVRHLKDGAHGNQISKATLLLAIERLINRYYFVYYFPAYEIVLDDLRDYRFYDKDLTHLSEIAIDYVFGRFSDVFFSTETLEVVRQVNKILARLQHKPLHGISEQYLLFVRQTADMIEKFIEKYPFIDFYDDLKLLNEMIIK